MSNDPEVVDGNSADAKLPEDLDTDDLELAYQAALEKLDAAEHEMEQAWFGLQADAPSDPVGEVESHADAIDESAPETDPATEPTLENTAAELLVEFDADASAGDQPRIRPRQILEAALFVGGEPLTSKRLCSLLNREFDQEFVQRKLSELNGLYAEQGRPYEIRLEEGGYRLQLRSEFEEVRHRVYGLGPKEVKLSQEALEVLSFVAYRQPVTRQELEDAGKSQCGSVLRQLLRRDLIQLQRGDSPGDVTYRTTARFLEVFGLSALEELPTNEDFEFK